MPGEVKTHGEIKYKDAPAEVEDEVVGQFENVRIYRRTSRMGLSPTINATDRQKAPIQAIARRLHALGFGVKVERFVLGPVYHYDVEAVWPGSGEPPPLPFS